MSSPAAVTSSALRAVAAALLSSAAFAAAAAADLAYRVRDINPDARMSAWGGLCSRDETDVAREFPGLVLADADGGGCGVYALNPTASALDLVRAPVEFGAGAGRVLGRGGALVFFEASTSTTGLEIWRSDGTAAGTYLVRDSRPGPEGIGWWVWLEAAQPTSYFTPWSEDAGVEIWATDGTPGGTRLVRDIRPGGESSVVGSDRLIWNGLLFFVADDGVEGAEVWRTDGTEAGTFAVSALPFEPGYGGDVRFGRLPDAAFFYSRDADWRKALWRTDGTVAGTEKIWTAPGPAGSEFYPLSTVGGRVLFAYSEGGQLRIWSSDGTAAGTQLVAALPGSDGGWLYGFYPAGQGAIFFADDGVHGREPWVTGGTSETTRLLLDVWPGPVGSLDYDQAKEFALLGNLVLMLLDDGVHGREIWATDGTQQGTVLVADMVPGTTWAGIDLLGAAAGYEIFALHREGFPTQLWRTDGTPGGTMPITALGGRVSTSSPMALTDAGGLLYLTADSGATPWPWRSDGTEAGTYPLAGDLTDLSPDATDFTALDDGTMVANTDADEWSLIWSSAGDTIQPLQEVSYCSGHFDVPLGHAPWSAGPVALFPWWSESAGSEPWATDGTLAGTGPWLDLLPGPDSSSPHAFTELADEAWFTALDAAGLEHAWRTRGTPETTASFARLSEAPIVDRADALWPLDVAAGKLFFVRDTFDGAELWFSAGGTSSPVLLRTGLFWAIPLGVSGERMLFAALEFDDPGIGSELWASDGTPWGTRLVRDIWSGPVGSRLDSGVEVGGRVLFRACEPARGCELWASDGTSEGTVRLADLEPGPASSFPSGLSKIYGRVLFSACRLDTGCEPWITDGTAAGTRALPEIAPGPYSGLPTDPYQWSREPRFVRSGGLVYFAGDDGTGTELWALALEIFSDGFETGDASRWDPPTPPGAGGFGAGEEVGR